MRRKQGAGMAVQEPRAIIALFVVTRMNLYYAKCSKGTQSVQCGNSLADRTI